MPCFYPVTGWKSRKLNANKKRDIVFNKSQGYMDLEVQVPCGQCIGCRLDRSRQWALRCMHEASLYTENSYITLTYNEDNIPVNYGLDKKAFPKFMKRLRKKYSDKKIRFFHCGEYGSENGRPHYHAILFNHDFKDKEFFNVNQNQNIIYRSATLEKLWPYGFSTIGEVTYQSCAYVARYVVKKVNGEKALEEYCDIDLETGEILREIEPEYATMSRRPGIAKEWFDKYKSDCFPKDFVTINGQKVSIPKYYDYLLELEDPNKIRTIKTKRVLKRKKYEHDNTPERLEAREQVKLAQNNMLKRSL